MLRIFLPVLFSSSADTQQSPHTPPSMQQTLIEAALTSPKSIEKGVWNYALGPTSTKADCCTWKMTDCEDGVVHAVLFYKFAYFVPHVELQYLPQTVRYIHLHCTMPDFSPRILPRDLRYIYLAHTTVHNGGPPHGWPKKATHILNTADFPTQLEEVSLQFNSPLYKTVLIASLPRNMRYLSISNMGHIQRLVMANEALPECFRLCNVYLLSKSSKTDLVEMRGQDVDERVRAINMKSKSTHRIDLKQYRYFTPLNNKCIERFRGI